MIEAFNRESAAMFQTAPSLFLGSAEPMAGQTQQQICRPVTPVRESRIQRNRERLGSLPEVFVLPGFYLKYSLILLLSMYSSIFFEMLDNTGYIGRIKYK